MRSTFEFGASAVVTLLVTIGPLETAAIFGLLRAAPVAPRVTGWPSKRLSSPAVSSSSSPSAGHRFFELLHVSVPAFQVAAGILLILQSIELIFAHPSGLSALTAGEVKEAKVTSEIAVFPLAIPLIAGPASITAAMLLIGQAGTDLVKVAAFFLSLLLALVLTWPRWCWSTRSGGCWV